MAKIGVSLNEVLRDFLGQFIYTYDKYIEPINIKTNEITNLDFLKYFKFKTIDELNTFLYLESPLEIFGHADQLTDGIMNQFNIFIMDIKDDEEHELELVSKEVNKSIPATFFFLSKTGCRIENVRFVQKSINEWDGLDFLITADPEALKNKPNGKISIKIKAPYNTGVSGDYELDSILDFIKDSNLRNKILNTKITNYEEI